MLNYLSFYVVVLKIEMYLIKMIIIMLSRQKQFYQRYHIKAPSGGQAYKLDIH